MMVKTFHDMFSHFDTILACDTRMDGQTQSHSLTDILRQHSPRYTYTIHHALKLDVEA